MKAIPQIEPWQTGKERRMVDSYLKSGGWITEFTETSAFEREIARFVGAKYVVATTSGTSALILALEALRVGRGDKVIVPNLTMVASANAVRFLGAEPVFADIDPATLCIDVRTLKVPRGTKVLMHVSLNGRSGDMRGVRAFCRAHKLDLLEDACQAFASKHRGRSLGTFGRIGCYSFSPHKIITTGQGGVVVTNERELYERAKRFKDFGRLVGGTDYHEHMGLNFKFTDLQAAFGRAQLSTIRERVKRKRALYRTYRTLLKNVPQVAFPPTDLAQTTPWFVDILVPEGRRDALAVYLKNKGIGARPFYPAVTAQPIYRKGAKRTPVAERLSRRGLWLPSSCMLTKSEVRYVCRAIKDFFHG